MARQAEGGCGLQQQQARRTPLVAGARKVGGRLAAAGGPLAAAADGGQEGLFAAHHAPPPQLRKLGSVVGDDLQEGSGTTRRKREAAHALLHSLHLSRWPLRAIQPEPSSLPSPALPCLELGAAPGHSGRRILQRQLAVQLLLMEQHLPVAALLRRQLLLAHSTAVGWQLSSRWPWRPHPTCASCCHRRFQRHRICCCSSSHQGSPCSCKSMLLLMLQAGHQAAAPAAAAG